MISLFTNANSIVIDDGLDPVGNWFDATMMTVNIY